MTSKECRVCKNTKELGEFPRHKQMADGHLHRCKVCTREYHREYDRRPERKEKAVQYYEDNRDDIKQRNLTRWNENAEALNEKRRERYANDEEYKERTLESAKASNARLRPERRKKRRETDEGWRLIQVCRTRMWNALNGRAVKTAKTTELLGCTGDELKEYLETTKREGVDYSGELHIDHIIPCSSFDFTDPEQQRRCFHYTNLQILTAEENLKKSDRLLSP
jgi:hypothetical protein